MKKRPPPPKDPGMLEHENLQKAEEIRHMKQKMNELAEENRRAKAAQARLEKLVKKDEGAGSGSDTQLNPRDAQQVSSMIDDQRRKLEEKDKMIKSLMAGSRMQDIGGKQSASHKSNPAAVYGAAAATRRPQKKSATTARPASASHKLRNSGASSSSTARGNEENEAPDFQPSRSASARNLAQSPQSPQRSPGASASDSSESKEENHYLGFNARLQSRLNSSQNFHRNALGVDGQDSSTAAAAAAAAASAGISPEDAPGHLDDLGFDGSGGAGVAPGDVSELVWIRRELRQKKAKIASLQNHFEHLTVSFRVEKDLQKITLQQCEDLKASLAASQARERNYQRQLESLEDSRLQLEHQAQIITDLQSDKRALEERIGHLHTNLFQGDSMEALRHKQLLNEHMSSISKLQGEIEEKERLIKSLRQTNHALLEKSSFGDSVLRDKQDLQRENQSLRDKCRELTEKLVVFSVDSGVEVDELERALDIVRRQKDDPSRVAFLSGGTGGEAADPALDTVPSLRRRLSELELKCRDYILEIQTKSDLLNIQSRLNTESKRTVAEQKAKIASLQLEAERMKYELVHRPAIADNLSESIFAMSEDGSDAGDGALRAADQLTGLENLIAFRVLSANLNPSASVFLTEAGEPSSTPPLTFLTADFFDFESSYSEVFGGYNPAYRFTTQFAVDSDQFLVAHLESEDLVVGVYQKLQGEAYRKIGVCYIALRGLLAPAAAIEGRAQIMVAAESKSTGVRGQLRDAGAGQGQGDEFEQRHTLRAGGSDAILGELHYVMRMKRPIVSTPPSPASSRGATPTQGRSRRGSLGNQLQPAAGQLQHRASQLQSYQPSILSNTLSLHHSNRDVQPQGSRASMQQQASAESSGRPSPALGPMQQQSQQQGNFSRQPSSRAPIQTQAQSGQQQQQQQQFDERLTMDEFGEPQQQQQSRPPASRQQSQFQLQDPPQLQRPSNPRAPSAREVGGGGGFSRAQSLAQQQQSQAASSWEAEVDASAAPAPAQRRPTLSHQSTHARTAEQEERDYQELINNPDSQAELFGNGDDEQF